MRDEREEATRDRALPTGTESGADGENEPTIVIEDEALRRGFTQLPNYLFQVRGLSHSAKLTYALILSYAWQKDYCFPGQESMAHDLEVSTRSVIEYLKELQAHGLIRIQRRGLGRTNVYHVLRYPPTPENPSSAPASYQEVKQASHQGLKRASHPDVPRSSHPEMREIAHQEVRKAAHNKNAAPAKHTSGEKNTPQQDLAAVTGSEKGARKGRRASKRAQAAQAAQAAQGALFSSPDGTSLEERMARAALQAHGVHNERVLAQLTVDPAEVIAQVERLHGELARGAVANPAGWLVEAIRGRYRPGEEGMSAPAAGSAPYSQPPSYREDTDRPDAPDTTPEASAWRSICAELRGELTPENYGRFFAPAVAQSLTGNRLTVGVPDAFHLHWLDRRLRGAIERAAARSLGDVSIAFVVAGRA